jgi:hypothetical protein
MLTAFLLILGVILLLAVLSVLGNVNKYLRALTALTEAKTANVEADTETILNQDDNEELDEDPDFNPYEEDEHEGLGEDTFVDPLPLLRLAMLLRAARQAHEQTQTGGQPAEPATTEAEPALTPDPETAEVPAGVTCAACGITGTTGPVEEPAPEPEPEHVPDATGDSTPIIQPESKIDGFGN